MTEPSLAPRLVTLTDFDSVDIEAPIAGCIHVDCFPLEQAFEQATKNAELDDKEIQFQVYRLLTGLCSFHFRPDDPAAVFGPQYQWGERRSPIPEDFRGEQSSILKAVLPKIENPGLRARIADTVWKNDRREAAAAHAAIDAYCEAAEGLRDGRYQLHFDGGPRPGTEEVNLAQRALWIASKTHKRGQLPPRVMELVCSLYDLARDRIVPVFFAELGELVLQYGLKSPDEIAQHAEALAEAAAVQPNPYFMAIKRAAKLAAIAYDQANDGASSQRCLRRSVEFTLAMRGTVDSASAQASWVRTAIKELRRIPDSREWQERLNAELRTLQADAINEMGVISTPIDLQEQSDAAIKLIDEISLSEAMRQLAFVCTPHPLSELKKQATEVAQAAPLTAMMGTVHVDEDGKVISETPGASLSGEPSRDWFNREIDQHERLRRQIVLQGTIEPARITLNGKYSISERHVAIIAAYSPFVPQGRRGIFTLGFARLFQGDFVSAAHLLIPQLENSVRHLLLDQGKDPSKIMNDMLQEDRSLSALLDRMRNDIVNIFGPDNADEMDRLFNLRPGPALRHEFAHGKISTGDCFSPDILYACWYIYHLCCVPLLQRWDEYIAPSIEAV